MKAGKAYIGTSGYMYRHWWDGIFYPEDLPQRKWLEFYSQHFKTVELNVTFYRLPALTTFQGWHRRTPDDFAFAVKGSRFITHMKRLKEPEEPLKILRDRSMALERKLSVILWQLPPRFKVDVGRLKGFIDPLKRMEWTRHAFEFREESWFCSEVFRILEKADMSLCLADWPILDVEMPATASYIYLRRHGAQGEVYGGCYSDKQLRSDAKKVGKWLREGKDVYIYFNNDAQGYAVKNALQLEEMVGSQL